MLDKYGITQFDGNDFDHWKCRMEMIFDANDVKECIETEVTGADEALNKKDKKCKSILMQCIANSHLQYVKDKPNSFQMWHALIAVFQRKGMASQLYIRRKLLSMKLPGGEQLEKHFVKFEETIREFKAVGAKLEEIDIVCHLLLTFPKDYDPIVTALETLETEKLMLEFVKGKFLDQEIKRKNDHEENENDTTTAFSTKMAYSRYKKQNYTKNNSGFNKNYTKSFNFNCHNCGKLGHQRKDCRFLKQANHSSAEKRDDHQSRGPRDDHHGYHITCLAEALKSSTETETESDMVNFYVDSGATDHMVND